MDKKEKKKEKKEYLKPEIEKHKAVAIVSGSGGDDDPCVYQEKNFLNTYYH